jgi:hypothetical protein
VRQRILAFLKTPFGDIQGRFADAAVERGGSAIASCNSSRRGSHKPAQANFWGSAQQQEPCLKGRAHNYRSQNSAFGPKSLLHSQLRMSLE